MHTNGHNSPKGGFPRGKPLKQAQNGRCARVGPNHSQQSEGAPPALGSPSTYLAGRLLPPEFAPPFPWPSRLGFGG